MADGVLLDLDGTLVDSVYAHVSAWIGAFRQAGHDVPAWHVHAAIGMGSSRLVPWLLGWHPGDADELSDEHKRRFLADADLLRPTVGARALLDDLAEREVPYRVATSASSDEREALLDALGRADLPTADSDDVESSKPAPDLVLAGCRSLGLQPSAVTLVGDSPWDAEAAGRAGARMIAVRCGGFGDAALRGLGAADVVDDPRGLVGRL